MAWDLLSSEISAYIQHKVPNALCLGDPSGSAEQRMRCWINSQECRAANWLNDRWKIKYTKVYNPPFFAKSR